jgi:hypothetical protein
VALPRFLIPSSHTPPSEIDPDLYELWNPPEESSALGTWQVLCIRFDKLFYTAFTLLQVGKIIAMDAMKGHRVRKLQNHRASAHERLSDDCFLTVR